MASLAEQSVERGTVSDIMNDMHDQAYALAHTIPIFDSSSRESPEVGEVYAHSRNWHHPSHHMPASERTVRVATVISAPFLLEVWSLHPDDHRSGTILPCLVKTFGDAGRPEFTIEQRERGGLITVERGPIYDDERGANTPGERSAHKPGTSFDNLPKPKRELLDEVSTGILGMIAATRCLVSVDIAARKDTAYINQARVQMARATVEDVFTLLK